MRSGDRILAEAGMWYLTFYRRRSKSELCTKPIEVGHFGFRLLEVISDTEEEVRRYYDYFVGNGLAIAAEIVHEGVIVARYIENDSVFGDNRPVSNRC